MTTARAMIFPAAPAGADSSHGPTGRRVRMLYAGLAVANLTAWTWALLAFSERPALLAAALGVYALGLRHGFDADHIVAIDNVTRRLVQTGSRPVTVGLYFALGHSAIVALAAAFLASSVGALQRIDGFRAWGGTVATATSAGFLLIVAAMNARVLLKVASDLRSRAGRGLAVASGPEHERRGGPLQRLLEPLLKMVSRSWHMFPLGFLFGLGFDTATEVAMFGVAAGSAASGLPLTSVLVFPALFAAGMASVDATDGVLMLGAYDWAHVDPQRKLRYNLAVTSASVGVAVLIAGIQLTSLAKEHLVVESRVAEWLATLSASMSLLGALIVGAFMLCWATSRMLHLRTRAGR